MRPTPPRFTVFFDGDCPLCRREIDWVRKKDRQRRIQFIDIASPDFRASNWGKSYPELMAQLHGMTPDGRWVLGVEVFRRLYTAAGFGWLVAPTRLPLIRNGFDWGYRFFARHRLRLTGRCGANACESKL